MLSLVTKTCPRRFLLLIALASLVRVPCHGIDIVVSGSWNRTISTSDLVAGAGTDLGDSYESASDHVSMTLSGTTGGADAWRISVRRVDTNWHADVRLWIRRTGDGTGGSVSGGTSYLEVTTLDQTFFTGSGDVTTIPAQLKLTGFSVQVPPASYGATLWITVVDT